MFTKHRGEFYLVMGGMVFAFNGVVSTVVLEHISPYRLAQIRAVGALVFLLAIALIIDRKSLAATPKQMPKLFLYGIVGFAAVQAGYFLGIQRGIPLSLVLVIEFTAPIWIALWIKYVRKHFVPNSMWGAIALSLLGLMMLAQVWNGLTLDAVGLLGCILSAFALTAYFLVGKSFGTTRSALSLTVWGFATSSIAWMVTMPVWKFPFEVFTIDMNLRGIFEGSFLPGWALLLWIITMGTIVPYLLVISGLRRLSASTSSVIGMLEPVMAGIFAWIWLNQSWNAIQLTGGVIVLVGIYIADRARSKVD
jgi:drug/metabolite transporter (DMT)-like permease